MCDLFSSQTEEQKGLIRWLRPEFQNPGGKQAAVQASLGVPATDTEEPGDDTTAAEAGKPWPKKMPEQIAAVRDLVLRGTTTWSAPEVARAFTKANRKDVAAVLESLAALGIVLGLEGAGGVRYRAAARVGGG